MLACIWLGVQTFYGFVSNDILYLSLSWPGPVRGGNCVLEVEWQQISVRSTAQQSATEK